MSPNSNYQKNHRYSEGKFLKKGFSQPVDQDKSPERLMILNTNNKKQQYSQKITRKELETCKNLTGQYRNPDWISDRPSQSVKKSLQNQLYKQNLESLFDNKDNAQKNFFVNMQEDPKYRSKNYNQRSNPSVLSSYDGNLKEIKVADRNRMRHSSDSNLSNCVKTKLP